MAHKSRMGCVVIDCKVEDLGEAAAFWSGALGYMAHKDAKHPEYVTLETPDREARILLQAVSHESRLHMDIETSDPLAERDRLLALGAREIGPCKNWIVMEAPTGHRFCLVGPQRVDFEQNATEWSGD